MSTLTETIGQCEKGLAAIRQAVWLYEQALETPCVCDKETMKNSRFHCPHCANVIAARNLLRYSSPEEPEPQGN
jgi:hypothetical protein